MYHSSQVGYSAGIAPVGQAYFNAAAMYRPNVFTPHSGAQLIRSSFTPAYVTSDLESARSAYRSWSDYVPTSLSQQQVYSGVVDSLLLSEQAGGFVGDALRVKAYLEQTFFHLFSRPFPSSVKVSVLDWAKFKALGVRAGVIGLSLNRSSRGMLSEIFALEGSLGRVLLTLGHELGHVLSPTLASAHDEEAKAYAFSFLWMDAIRALNVGGLANALVDEIPANNGLHDVAYRKVCSLLRSGMNAYDIWQGFVTGTLHVRNELLINR